MFKPEDIKYITETDLPFAGREHFSMRPELSGYRDVGDYDRFMALDAMSHYAIYFAMADRSYEIGKNKIARERHIYLVDVLAIGQIAGYGAISNSLTSSSTYVKDKPLVLNTETVPDFLRQGYGRRRYMAMNAASLLMFSNPIHSREKGNMLSDSAEKTWDSLVREGLAESYEETGASRVRPIQRYRFKTAE